MPDFDEIKHKVGEAAEVVAEHAVNIARTAGEKITVAARVAKLSAEVISERDKIRRSHLRLGKLYVEQFADTPHDVMLADVEKVLQGRQRIAALNEEIERVKKEGATQPDYEVYDSDPIAEDDDD